MTSKLYVGSTQSPSGGGTPKPQSKAFYFLFFYCRRYVWYRENEITYGNKWREQCKQTKILFPEQIPVNQHTVPPCLNGVCRTPSTDIMPRKYLLSYRLFIFPRTVTEKRTSLPLPEYFDISMVQDTSVVEKRRSLQAKKQRLLKGLETLMRMAPDVVAQRPGGANDSDWLSPDGSDGTALLQQGNGRYVYIYIHVTDCAK